MKKALRITIALFSMVAIQACIFGEGEEEKDTATMCYVKAGSTITVNCRHDSLGTCSSDGKTALGGYDSWDECWDDVDTVLKKAKETGVIEPGPNSNEKTGGSGGGGGGGGGGSYNWSFTCSDGVGGTKTLPIPTGPCESQYKSYGKAFGCNDVANFNSTCVSLYTCLVRNVSSSYQQNLDYCRNYR